MPQTVPGAFAFLGLTQAECVVLEVLDLLPLRSKWVSHSPRRPLGVHFLSVHSSNPENPCLVLWPLLTLSRLGWGFAGATEVDRK